MDPASGIIKIVGAFVAGVVIALGGTLIYVKTTAMIHPHREPAAQVAAASPEATGAPEAVGLPEAADSPKAEPEAEAKPSGAEAAPAASDEVETIPSHAARAQRVTAGHPRKHRVPETRVIVPPPAPALSQPIQPANTTIAQNIPAQPAPPEPSQPTPEPAASQIEQTAATPAAPVSPEPRQPKVITLEAGTLLPVRLDETLSTDHNYTGDTFRGSLDRPIIVDGFIIADKGSKVLGKIVVADRAGRVKGVSNMKLMVTDINTTDGQRVRVQTASWEKQGTSSPKQDAAKIAGGAALGAIIGAIAGGGKGAAIGAGAGGAAGTGVVLGTRGHETVVPSETRISFRLDSPVTITERLN